MSFDSSGLPVVVCAPETTQLFDPGAQDSQVESAGISRESREDALIAWSLPGACGTAALGCADACFETLPPASSSAGAWSRHELVGYRSAMSSGESNCPIFSRRYSISYCGLSSWLMPMPI